MPKKGPAPKPAHLRQRRNATPQPAVALTLVPPSEIPPAPKDFLVATRKEWDAFWASPIAASTVATDEASVLRLFTYRDEWRRCRNALAKGRFVKGSMGQVVLNPAAKQMLALEKAISALEGELGLTPLARMKLGFATGQAAQSLREFNSASDPPRRVESEVLIADDDPRFTPEEKVEIRRLHERTLGEEGS